MGSNIIANPKKKYPADAELRHKQMMHRHAHNAAHGSVSFARASLVKLAQLPSLTPDAKEIAEQLQPLLDALAEEMYLHRLELDGTIKEVKHSESSEEYTERHRRSHDRFMSALRAKRLGLSG